MGSVIWIAGFKTCQRRAQIITVKKKALIFIRAFRFIRCLRRPGDRLQVFRTLFGYPHPAHRSLLWIRR
jgi:hypothetical protein